MTTPINAKFRLTNQDGQAVTELTYRGDWLVVLFGFTNCQVVCPRALSRLSSVLDSLDPAITERIRPLYVTVDPARDTPEVMKAFLQQNYPRFTGLTGTEDQVEEAKEAFAIFARRKADSDAPDGYVVPHTAISYLIDPKGQYATHWTDAVDASDIIDGIRSHIGTAGLSVE